MKISPLTIRQKLRFYFGDDSLVLVTGYSFQESRLRRHSLHHHHTTNNHYRLRATESNDMKRDVCSCIPELA